MLVKGATGWRDHGLNARDVQHIYPKMTHRDLGSVIICLSKMLNNWHHLPIFQCIYIYIQICKQTLGILYKWKAILLWPMPTNHNVILVSRYSLNAYIWVSLVTWETWGFKSRIIRLFNSCFMFTTKKTPEASCRCEGQPVTASFLDEWNLKVFWKRSPGREKRIW